MIDNINSCHYFSTLICISSQFFFGGDENLKILFMWHDAIFFKTHKKYICLNQWHDYIKKNWSSMKLFTASWKCTVIFIKTSFTVHHQSDTDLPLVPPQTDYQQETTCTVYWCQYTGLGGTDGGPTQHLKLT